MPEIKRHADWYLGYLWQGSGSGEAFSKNNHSTEVRVYLCHRSESPLNSAQQWEAGKARTKAQAESVARQFIRENGLRERLKGHEGLSPSECRPNAEPDASPGLN